MERRRLPGTLVAVAGLATLAAAAYLRFRGTTGWWPVAGQIGVVAVWVGGVAIYEADHQPVRFWRLLGLLWLPAIAVAAGNAVQSFLAPGSAIPLGPAVAVGWAVAAVAVPLSYALGATANRRWQWLVAGLVTAAPLLALAAFTLAFGPASEHGLGAILEEPRMAIPAPASARALTIGLAVGAWAGIPLYLLGRTARPPVRRQPSRPSPEGTLAVALAAILLGIGALALPEPADPTADPALAVAVLGPVVYVLGRGVLVALRRLVRAVG